MNQSPLLPVLLGATPVSRFLSDYYLKRPFGRSGASFDVLGSTSPMELIAASLSAQTQDILIGRQGSILDTPHDLTIEQAREFLSQGQTIGIRHVQGNHPQLQWLAQAFTKELGGNTDIHLYWTPAAQPGFGWHYDAEEVFILQLLGTKHWRIRKNTVHPWPLLESIPVNQAYGQEIMPYLSCQLKAGDWLYIPNGYWHCTTAEEESISLSVGIRASTCMDLFDLLRLRLLDSIEWRERLPCRSAADSSTRRVALREILHRLGLSLRSAMDNEEFLASILQREEQVLVEVEE